LHNPSGISLLQYIFTDNSQVRRGVDFASEFKVYDEQSQLQASAAFIKQ
jgi:hypothetical protein